MLCMENCINDSQCSKEEICVEGQCQERCHNDNHCEKGETCYKNSCITSCISKYELPESKHIKKVKIVFINML